MKGHSIEKSSVPSKGAGRIGSVCTCKIEQFKISCSIRFYFKDVPACHSIEKSSVRNNISTPASDCNTIEIEQFGIAGAIGVYFKDDSHIVCTTSPCHSI